MKNSSKISVIIPVYNPGKHLYQCLDSIINQTYKNLEIILVDDGSTDGSDKVCDDYQKKDSRIKVIHQENAGVSRARNVGLEQATGDYVNFPDSDDYIDADTYEILLETIEKEKVEAVCFEYFVTYTDQEIQHHASDNQYGVFDTEGAVHELLFSNRSFLCTKLLPMKAVKDLRFLEDIYRDEDTIFCMMALHRVKNAAFIDKALYHYVQSEESACRGKFRKNQLSAIDAIPLMETFLGENYPNMVKKWRCGYMHLMIMLYVDMVSDGGKFTAEKQRVRRAFDQLRGGITIKDMESLKNILKFGFFGFNPELFCRVHLARFKSGN